MDIIVNIVICECCNISNTEFLYKIGKVKYNINNFKTLCYNCGKSYKLYGYCPHNN